MIIVYIFCVVLIAATYISFFYRSIADNLEYHRNKPKEKAQIFEKAQITVSRRESGALTSFSVWDIYLNGENIGSIEDEASITVTTDKRINELTAKDSQHGAVSPRFRFFVDNGADSEVTLNGGKFVNPQRMYIVLPSDEIRGFMKIFAGIKMGAWYYWAILIGYYAAIFFLLGGKIPAIVLSFLPLIIFGFIIRPAYRGMVNYLSYNHPDAWGRISRDMHQFNLNNNLIFFDDEVNDLDYLEIKVQYERVLCAYLISMLAAIGISIYTIAVLANR